MDNYEISKDTLAIIPIDKENSLVYETEDDFIVSKNALEIIDDSCKYFGSSYEGRSEGTKNLIDVNYKLPIIIEESMNIIFFPTSSPRLKSCSWLSLGNIKSYQKYGDSTKIVFNNDVDIVVKISPFKLQNQILRASRLECVLHRRKSIKK